MYCSQSSYTAIPMRVRRDMTSPAAAAPAGAPAPASASHATSTKKVSDDIDKLYQNCEAERGGRPLPLDERADPKSVEAVNKAAKHNPPYLPDHSTFVWMRDGGASFVSRDKFGREKKINRRR